MLLLIVGVIAGAIVGAAVARARLLGQPGAWWVAIGVTAAWIAMLLAASAGAPRVIAVAAFVLASWAAQRLHASDRASSLLAERAEALAARRDAREWERHFVSRAWMLDPHATYDFNPERDVREFDRWIVEQKRVHGPRHFADLRDRLKAEGRWQPEWSDRSA